MDLVFLGAVLTACSLFRLQLPFKCINFFEKETGRPKTSFRVQLGFKASLVVFLLFKFGDCSTISRVVVVLVTIVTPNVGPLMIFRFRRLDYTTGNRSCLLIIYW
jgi:hypothetical protein